jgi:hypothetical protein
MEIPELSTNQFLFVMGFILPVLLATLATVLTIIQPNLPFLQSIWGGVAGIGGGLALVSLFGLGMSNIP